MKSISPLWIIGLVIVVVLISWGVSSHIENQAKHDDSLAIVTKWANNLDSRTDDAGIYIKDGLDEFGNMDIPEQDSWGKNILANYSKGGMMEIITVSSAGPDGQFNTKDDIMQLRQSTNFSGIGSGIKRNIEETSANAARGAVSGAIQGATKETAKLKDVAKSIVKPTEEGQDDD